MFDYLNLTCQAILLIKFTKEGGREAGGREGMSSYSWEYLHVDFRREGVSSLLW